MDTISLHTITWNVGAKFPAVDTNMVSLLQDTKPDILLLGLQEVNSQPQNMLTDNLLVGEDPWTASLRTSLAPFGYMKVRSVRLMGIVLSFFCLEKHLAFIRGLETQYTRLGYGGYWGNKGCVSVRFQVYGIKVAVVNCHLAAHVEYNQDRIDSYNTILGSHLYSNEETEMILYHDYVFFIGDLNFRLQPDKFTFQQIDLMVSQNEHGKLLSEDQLTLAKKSGAAFSELQENLPTFPPTFKYKVGSTSAYDMKRLPAWTDRILFTANTANYPNFKLSLNQHSYSAHQDYVESDHKPVSSGFSLSVFSEETANKLLLPAYKPIVTFIDAGPYFCNEDMQVLYTVKMTDRRLLKTWDWVGVFRTDCNNLEDHQAYTWAASKLARDQVYQVMLDESVFPAPGDFKLVYLSAESKDILGVSGVIRVRQREWQETKTETAKEVEEHQEL